MKHLNVEVDFSHVMLACFVEVFIVEILLPKIFQVLFQLAINMVGFGLYFLWGQGRMRITKSLTRRERK